MELEFFGANCFRIKTKHALIVVDDNLSKLGGKSIVTDKTAAFYTSPTLQDKKSAGVAKLVIDIPGEFEVGDVTVTGVQARSHIDEEGTRSATVFQFMHSGQTITITGHIHPDISGDVIELISGTDVLVLPVGGNGYTIDPVGATSLIKKIEPDIVVPAQYDMELRYDVPAQPLAEFGKVSSLSLEDVQDSLKLSRAGDDSTTQSRVVVLRVK